MDDLKDEVIKAISDLVKATAENTGIKVAKLDALARLLSIIVNAPK